MEPGGRGATDGDGLSTLEQAAVGASLGRTVEAVRDLLGVEIAFVTSMDDEFQRFEMLAGDGSSFGVNEDTVIPVEETYCHHVLEGRLPNFIPDVRQNEFAMSLPATEAVNLGAYVSLPLTFSNGEFYGTMCAVSHEAQPQIGEREEQFLRVFARLAIDQIEREHLQDRVVEAERGLVATTALLQAIEARDSYTAEHSKAVVELAATVAEQLGIGESEGVDLARVALLHDIGKIAIPDSILRKPGPLDDQEWELMRKHPEYGSDLIERTPGVVHLAPAVRAEHERWDGEGYPDGLAGEEIPLASQIVFACDAYHAMVSDRPYRKGLGEKEARRRLRDGAGTQFNPAVVTAMLAALEQHVEPAAQE